MSILERPGVVGTTREPKTRRDLWRWLHMKTGVRLATQHVCEGHTAPMEIMSRWLLEEPKMALCLGPRGGGKSFMAALETHVRSRFRPRYQTRILGGSYAQSRQVHDAIRDAVLDGKGPDGDTDAAAIARMLVERVEYTNGSGVEMLAASTKSVRGPHVPSLKLDEVDEMKTSIRDAALGMAMEKRGRRSSVVMTSTWHNLGGPMEGLIDQAKAAAPGTFPFDTFCIFEVLERCPDSRSGRELENCPACPIFSWCHADRDRDPFGRPKAKRSNGHYRIGDLCAKTIGVSPRVFVADYLCGGPKGEGIWFTTWDDSRNVCVTDRQGRNAAEYDGLLPVHVAIDPGVHTGAVFFQVRRTGIREIVTVFADYYSYDKSAELNAHAILGVGWERCDGRMDKISMDAAGGSKNPVGPTVLGEYERCGIRVRYHWPLYPGTKNDGLQLLEAFVLSASGQVNLLVHERCQHLIKAMKSYQRAKVGEQFVDSPLDPQHPAEEHVDALRGGLQVEFPERRRPPKTYRTVPGRMVF